MPAPPGVCARDLWVCVQDLGAAPPTGRVALLQDVGARDSASRVGWGGLGKRGLVQAWMARARWCALHLRSYQRCVRCKRPDAEGPCRY